MLILLFFFLVLFFFFRIVFVFLIVDVIVKWLCCSFVFFVMMSLVVCNVNKFCRVLLFCVLDFVYGGVVLMNDDVFIVVIFEYYCFVLIYILWNSLKFCGIL